MYVCEFVVRFLRIGEGGTGLSYHFAYLTLHGLARVAFGQSNEQRGKTQGST